MSALTHLKEQASPAGNPRGRTFAAPKGDRRKIRGEHRGSRARHTLRGNVRHGAAGYAFG
jgi:hypothetical protein